jgi:acrylyl-CoA reductase (NADPH)
LSALAFADLPAAVLPHILRGVALLGIDPVMAPVAKRDRAWARLSRDLSRDHLQTLTVVEPMAALPRLAEAIVAGQIRGRVGVGIEA